MDFQKLYNKIKQLSEEEMPTTSSAPVEAPVEECGDMPTKSVGPSASGDELLIGEEPVEECGDMPAPKQQNTVSMNVSMNGSGADGIRDLMSILKNIEQGGHAEPHGDVVLGMGEEQGDGGFGAATTSPSTAVAGVDAVTATGNDLASKGAERPKMNGGGNPMQEALIRRLSQHYNEVKDR